MTVSVTQLGARTDTTPGASSEVGPSVDYVSGRNYFVAVEQYRTASTDPALPTLSGFGSPGNWTQVGDLLWTATGTNRRRLTVFHYRATSGGTAAVVTAAYASAPTNITIRVVEVSGLTTGGFVSGNVQASAAAATFSANTLREAITMNALAQADNRVLQFVATNQSAPATLRGELAADTNGDVDWTSFAYSGTTSAPTNSAFAAWYDNNTPDLTPGFLCSGAGSFGQIAIELDASVATPSSKQYWGIAMTTAVVVAAGFGAAAFGSAPFGVS